MAGPVAGRSDGSFPNRVVIGGTLVSSQALRYTPAGVPIVTASLRHESEQSEAGQARRVECPLELVVIGEDAQRFAAIAPGSELKLAGFLAARHRNSPVLVLHVTEFRTIQTD